MIGLPTMIIDENASVGILNHICLGVAQKEIPESLMVFVALRPKWGQVP